MQRLSKRFSVIWTPNTSPYPLRFDRSKYYLNPLSIFSVPEVKKAFLAHCQHEHNSQALLFIEQVELLDKASNPFTHAEEIINTFIVTNAPFEINISAENKKQIIEDYNKALKNRSTIQARKLFSHLKDIVMFELLNDVFPRFVRTQRCTDAVTKVLHLQNIVMPREVITFPYKDEDFEIFLITQKDINFMRHLGKDDFDWQLLGAKSTKMNTYFSAKNFMPEVSFMKNMALAKFEVIFRFPFEKVVCALMPAFENGFYDPNFAGFKELEHFPYEKLVQMYGKEMVGSVKSTSITAIDVKFPFPLTRRRILMCSACKYDPQEQSFIFVHKPCQHPSHGKLLYTKKNLVPPITGDKSKKFWAYAIADFKAFIIKKIDEHRTHYIEINAADVGGWASSHKLQKFVCTDRGDRLRENCIKHLKKKPKSYNFEQALENLKKDPFGKLIVAELEHSRGKKG